MSLNSLAQAAERLSVSQSTVRRLIRDGTMPTYRVRDRLRVDVEAYLRENRVTTKGV